MSDGNERWQTTMKACLNEMKVSVALMLVIREMEFKG